MAIHHKCHKCICSCVQWWTCALIVHKTHVSGKGGVSLFYFHSIRTHTLSQTQLLNIHTRTQSKLSTVVIGWSLSTIQRIVCSFVAHTVICICCFCMHMHTNPSIYKSIWYLFHSVLDVLVFWKLFYLLICFIYFYSLFLLICFFYSYFFVCYFFIFVRCF